MSLLRARLGPAAAVVAPVLVTASVQSLPESARLALAYRRTAVLDGEAWRLFTAHLLHTGWGHWAMNVLAWGVLWLLFRDRLARPCLAGVAVASAGAVGLGLLLCSPGVAGYVGLSGVLHGVFAAAAVWSLKGPRWRGAALAAALAVKLGWEQLRGAAAATEALVGAPVIVEAHLYGAVGGAAAAALCLAAARRLTAPSG